MTASWLCAYMVFLLCMYTGRGRERKRDLPLLIMPPILWDKDSTLVTSFNLNYLLNALSSNKVTFGFTIGIWRVAAKSLQSCPTDSVRPHRWQPTRLPHPWYIGLPRWLSGKEPACQYRRHGFDPGSRKFLTSLGATKPESPNYRPCVL